MKLQKKTLLTIIIWICFIAVDSLLACGLAELWVRMFIPVKNVCYYHDPKLGDMRCPNQKTYGYVEKGYKNILITNSLGFHDIERNKKKAPNTLRLHIYGDSLISGIGVPTDKTIPALLETYLNKFSLPKSVESLNMASAEDSTCAQLLIYELIGKKYSPDIVICYFMSDFSDNIFATHPRTRSPYFKLGQNDSLVFIPPEPVDMNTIVEKIKRSSLLVRLLANKLLASKFYHSVGTLKDKIKDFHFPSNTEQTAPSSSQALTHKQKLEQLLTEQSWPLTLCILQEFKNEVEANGAKFILVDGIIFTPIDAGKYKNIDLEQYCRNNGITYVPVYNEFQALKNNPNKRDYFLKDGHPTSLGNKTISRVLAKKLNKILKVSLR